MTQYSKIYKNCFNADALQSEVGSAPSLDRLNVIIYGLDGMTTIPYLMFIQKNVSDDSEKKKIYEYLEASNIVVMNNVEDDLPDDDIHILHHLQ